MPADHHDGRKNHGTFHRIAPDLGGRIRRQRRVRARPARNTRSSTTSWRAPTGMVCDRENHESWSRTGTRLISAIRPAPEAERQFAEIFRTSRRFVVVGIPGTGRLPGHPDRWRSDRALREIKAATSDDLMVAAGPELLATLFDHDLDRRDGRPDAARSCSVREPGRSDRSRGSSRSTWSRPGHCPRARSACTTRVTPYDERTGIPGADDTGQAGGFITMTTYALIHGAGDVGWYWHLVEAELRARGTMSSRPDLPIDDESASFNDYADTVIAAIGDRAGRCGRGGNVVRRHTPRRSWPSGLVPGTSCWSRRWSRTPANQPSGMFEATGYRAGAAGGSIGSRGLLP